MYNMYNLNIENSDVISFQCRDIMNSAQDRKSFQSKAKLDPNRYSMGSIIPGGGGLQNVQLRVQFQDMKETRNIEKGKGKRK